MPVVQEGAIRAARAYDQADRDARDHALCLGASGRGEVTVRRAFRLPPKLNVDLGERWQWQVDAAVESYTPDGVFISSDKNFKCLASDKQRRWRIWS
jgi:hypothetical protein